MAIHFHTVFSIMSPGIVAHIIEAIALQGHRDLYCIATSDGGFCCLNGDAATARKQICFIGERKAPESLRRAGSEFIELKYSHSAHPITLLPYRAQSMEICTGMVNRRNVVLRRIIDEQNERTGMITLMECNEISNSEMRK